MKTLNPSVLSMYKCEVGLKNVENGDQRIISEIEISREGARERPDCWVKSKLEHQLINKSPTLSPSPLPLSTSLSFMLHRLALRNARAVTLTATSKVFSRPVRKFKTVFFSTYFPSMSRPGHMLPPKPVCSKLPLRQPCFVPNLLRSRF